MSTFIKKSVEGKVESIIINRPDVKNALNSKTIDQLINAFDNASKNKNTSCIFLSSEGSEAFCAGADLEELQSLQSLEERRYFFLRVAKLIETIQACCKPIVCKVHGYALAGGLGMVAASDLVLAADDAQFGLPEIKLGLAPAVVMVPLAQHLTARALASLSLTADFIDAKKAMEISLITEIVKKSELDTQAWEMAKKIARYDLQALSTVKSLLRERRNTDLHSELEGRAARSAILSMSEYSKSTIAKFLGTQAK